MRSPERVRTLRIPGGWLLPVLVGAGSPRCRHPRPPLPSRAAESPRSAIPPSTGTTPTPMSSPRGSPRRPAGCKRSSSRTRRYGSPSTTTPRRRGSPCCSAWAARSGTSGPRLPANHRRRFDYGTWTRAGGFVSGGSTTGETTTGPGGTVTIDVGQATGAVPGGTLARPFVLTYDGSDGVEPHWVDRAPGGVTPDGIEFGADYVVGEGRPAPGAVPVSVSPGPDHGSRAPVAGPPRRRRRRAPEREGRAAARRRRRHAPDDRPGKPTARRVTTRDGRHVRRAGAGHGDHPGTGDRRRPRIANRHDPRLLGGSHHRAEAPGRHGTGGRADPARAAGTGTVARGDVGDAVCRHDRQGRDVRDPAAGTRVEAVSRPCSSRHRLGGSERSTSNTVVIR